MTAAEQRLRPYVAGLASEWLATTPHLTYRRISGTLAFVDISGFTKLTERLAARGKVGAEEMSDLLDSTFAELLRHAYSYGASLVKWGGDAVLLLFEGEGHATLAARAAYDMRTMMRSIGRLRTSAGPATLRMSVGIESGDLDFFLVGDHHRELLALGPVATATAEMEAIAEAGEIALGPVAASLLPASALGPAKDRAILLATPPSPPMRSRVWLQRSASEGLALALDPALARHLVEGTGDSEHRQVSAGFVEVRGVDQLLADQGPAETASALSRLVTTVDEECSRHHVTFWETDISPDGFKILLIGGAPASSGHDEHAMLHTAHAIATRHDGPLRIRLGVNAGRVFCGDFGPAFRRTFSVKGDAINLAARVMGKAGAGQVLATETVLAAAGGAFDVQPLPPFTVKGKAKPVHAAVVLREREVLASADSTPLVGRAAELAALRARWQSAQAGRGRACSLVGAAGIGKSRLAAELARLVPADAGWRMYCSDYDSATAYFPFRRLLRELLGVGPTEGVDVAARALVEVVGERAPQLAPWLPLLAAPVGVTVPMTAETAALGEEFRRPQTERAVIGLLAVLIDGPALFVVENLEHIDDASLTLLRRIARDGREHPWLLVTTTRQAIEWGAEEIAVGALEGDEARALARTVMTRPLAPHRLDTVVRRADGNPLFVLELTAAASASEDSELPATLEEMMAAQIDQLPSRERGVLRAAAVLGQRFAWPRLSELLGEDVPARTRWLLRPFLHGEDEAVFASSLVRMTAYEGLAFRRRLTLHARTAELLMASTSEPDAIAESLSYHYTRAQRYDDAWRFARIAAERAFAVPAYVEASALYDRAVAAGLRVAHLDPLEVAHDLERSGDALFRIGETQAALDRYAGARRRIRSSPAALARVELATARATHRLNGADPSLRWLRRARRDLSAAAAEGSGGDDPRLRTVIEIEEAYARYTAGRLRTAQLWCCSAVDHARAINDDVELARSLHLLDMILVASGAPGDEALALEALDAATRAGDNIRRCGILSQLGARAYYEGRWDLAISRYEQACDAGARGGDVWLVAVVRSNIGEVLVEQGRFADAEPILRDAVDVFRAADTPSPWAFAEVLLGRLCARSGRPQDSTAHFDEAQTLYRRLHLDTDAAELQLWRADAAVARGDSDAAMAFLADAPVGGALRLRTHGLALLQRADTVAGTGVLHEAVATARSGSPFELYCCLQALQRSPLLSATERAAARDEVADLELRLSIVPSVVLPYDVVSTLAIPRQRAGRPEATRTS